MYPFKSAKIFLCFAVLFFVAKPFLGFSIASRSGQSAPQNILAKSFTKRKAELPGQETQKLPRLERKLANPIQDFLLVQFNYPNFDIMLNKDAAHRFISNSQLNFSLPAPAWLLNGKLII